MDEADLLAGLRARAASYPTRWPVRRVGYGPIEDQFGYLRAPAPGAAAVPVVVLVHGGYWRARWRLDLMEALACEFEQRSVATWNIEYRRAEDFGWDAMTADVGAAVAALVRLAGTAPLDLERVVLLGHSAGAQLALRAAADLVATGTWPRPALVVSLAGVVDLVGAQLRDLGNGAARAALGGTAQQQPDRYARSSPLARLPLGVPQLVVTADADDPDLNDLHRAYAAAARAAGDEVVSIEGPGGHFAVIDPASEICGRCISDALGFISHRSVRGGLEQP